MPHNNLIEFKLMVKNLSIILAIILTVFPAIVSAQNPTSTNYELVQPTMDSVSGIEESTNYEALSNSSPLLEYTTSSSSYRLKSITASYIEAAIPTIACFETSTSGTTNCDGTPQNAGNGMQSVCSSPGCYDRAKVEIYVEGNPDDTPYALQVSTTSDFSSDISYFDGATHFLKDALSINDFLFECEWEGTTAAGYCASDNTTWQKYNVLGLMPGTTYYVRAAALHGLEDDGTFTQSGWSPSASVSTQHPSLTLGLDVEGTTSPPYSWTMPNLITNVVETTDGTATFSITSNALNGVELLVKGDNGGLQNTSNADIITSVNGDLGSTAVGYGLRNDDTTNSQTTNSYLGTITVSNLPSTFQDSATNNEVGQIPTSFVELFNSNSLPLLNGTSGYEAKAVSDFSISAGTYEEYITFVLVGTF
jgi:hypothetical protein